MLYAIKHRKTGRYVTGTRCYYPRRQIMKPYDPPVLLSDNGGKFPQFIESQFLHRGINPKYYKLVPVKIVEV